MLKILNPGGRETGSDACDRAIWFDLFEPTRDEELFAEGVFERDVPTPAERAALEESARNYAEDGTLFFTPTLLGRRDEGAFVSGPVTFMLCRDRLVTIRSINPRAFEVGTGRASARVAGAKTGGDIASALIEGSIERIADLLSEQADKADALSATLLTEDHQKDLKASLKAISRIGAIAAISYASLSSLQRCMLFLFDNKLPPPLNPERLMVLRNDIEELERQADALQTRAAFLQESTLGLINEKQTDVLRALSLATISFIPPTLVASIFGMNFEFMHWYDKAWGPPTAFGLMIVAPIALFAIARWRRWF